MSPVQRNRGGHSREGIPQIIYELTGLGGTGSEQGALQVRGKVGVRGGPSV